ncbi:tripartite tricarboxylate transporter substrate binding protein [Variovorax paradoxus]|uniref:Tripartite tricarboxylate transporter substrate binding protein n=1 Tax=Variovorax paradoxus TaxID=34073 RepID=A0A5Q0M6L1_VARPD|nr:tripartite tricarboxylate transporter substrate binding protein [Variovorax paradoxus]QFZ85086.1 tripartite tricarboxylate transporter substrate binding protein [Variovorax paradoxus]
MSITFLRLALFALVAAVALPAQSQGWPSRPVRWVVGYPAGGGTDIIVRLLAEEMGKSLGQPVIVDNKPGANTMIAAEQVARAQPDGYTILVADNGTLVNNAALYKKLSYDPVADFAPVTMIGRFQFVLLANPATGIRTFADMKRLVVVDPSKFNYASGGVGSPFHIGMELLKQEQGLSINHVPYKGMAPAVQALLSGDVQLMIADIATALPYIKAGKLAALATATPKRTMQLPEVPTLAELGVPSFPGWQALVVPARTPDDVKAKLEAALKAAVASPAAVRLFQEKGVEAVLSTPAELRSYQQAEIGRWHKFIHDRGISLD